MKWPTGVNKKKEKHEPDRNPKTGSVKRGQDGLHGTVKSIQQGSLHWMKRMSLGGLEDVRYSFHKVQFSVRCSQEPLNRGTS